MTDWNKEINKLNQIATGGTSGNDAFLQERTLAQYRALENLKGIKAPLMLQKIRTQLWIAGTVSSTFDTSNPQSDAAYVLSVNWPVYYPRNHRTEPPDPSYIGSNSTALAIEYGHTENKAPFICVVSDFLRKYYIDYYEFPFTNPSETVLNLKQILTVECNSRKSSGAFPYTSIINNSVREIKRMLKTDPDLKLWMKEPGNQETVKWVKRFF